MSACGSYGHHVRRRQASRPSTSTVPLSHAGPGPRARWTSPGSVRRRNRVPSEHLLAARRDAADLHDARPGRRHHGVAGQRGIRCVDGDNRGAAEWAAARRADRRCPAAPSAACGHRLQPLRRHSSTWLSTFEPRTAAARVGLVGRREQGWPASRPPPAPRPAAAPTPIDRVDARACRLRMAPRTARPSTTPAISPITTSAEDQKQRRRTAWCRGPPMLATM